MTLALTVYFWTIVFLGTLLFLLNLVLPKRLTPPEEKDPTKRAVTAGCGVVITAPFMLLMGLPLVYLQQVGLTDLGLPGWIPWAVFVAGMIAGIVNMLKPGRVTGDPSGLPLLGWLIAWHGLQVMGGG